MRWLRVLRVGPSAEGGLLLLWLSFLRQAFPFVLQSQDPRQLFAQGLDFCSQRGVFGLQVGDAFCSCHAPILPACAIPT